MHAHQFGDRDENKEVAGQEEYIDKRQIGYPRQATRNRESEGDDRQYSSDRNLYLSSDVVCFDPKHRPRQDYHQEQGKHHFPHVKGRFASNRKLEARFGNSAAIRGFYNGDSRAKPFNVPRSERTVQAKFGNHS